MIEAIKQFVISADFVFAIIIIGFIVVVALLLLENRRDNQKLVQLNQKVKDLLQGTILKCWTCREVQKSQI